MPDFEVFCIKGILLGIFFSVVLALIFNNFLAYLDGWLLGFIGSEVTWLANIYADYLDNKYSKAALR